jgi:rubrerythrin
MKRGTWLGLVAVAVTAGFMAAAVSKADVAAAPTAVDAGKSANGWSQKNPGKTFTKARPSQHAKQTVKQTVKYVCPMGDYVGDKPGKCPKCGMTLEKKLVTESTKKEIPAKH